MWISRLVHTAKFRAWRPHLCVGVNPLNYRSLGVYGLKESFSPHQTHNGWRGDRHRKGLASCDCKWKPTDKSSQTLLLNKMGFLDQNSSNQGPRVTREFLDNLQLFQTRRNKQIKLNHYNIRHYLVFGCFYNQRWTIVKYIYSSIVQKLENVVELSVFQYRSETDFPQVKNT